mmetsp:Transcript_5828/g.17242  ORF Transcript_5828/g.17242 Transcript_5828/m.17242 type:complete len:258 (-) Transcript_5828:210-983(-)
MYSLGGRCALPRAMDRSRQALSMRPRSAGKAPPPCAKQILRLSGKRSNAPPRIIRLMDKWVSIGMPTVHAIMKSLVRLPGPTGDISQGCTRTGKSSSAQCCRNATSRSSSRSRAPWWLPIWTPTWPVRLALDTSAHARSTSWSGTWHSASRRPCAALSRAISTAMSLKSVASAAAVAASRCHWNSNGVWQMICRPTPIASKSLRRSRTSQHAAVTGRNSASPTISMASHFRPYPYTPSGLSPVWRSHGQLSPPNRLA